MNSFIKINILYCLWIQRGIILKEGYTFEVSGNNKQSGQVVVIKRNGAKSISSGYLNKYLCVWY